MTWQTWQTASLVALRAQREAPSALAQASRLTHAKGHSSGADCLGVLFGVGKMKVLIACEFSGVVRDAFRRKGVDAVSCDLLETESTGPHHRGCVLDLIQSESFDLMVAFPPCTHLSRSGARWWPEKRKDGSQQRAIKFVFDLWNSGIKKVAIENPVGILSTVFKKPSQIIEPWQFGHGETKKTCLWLKGLPPLMATKIVDGRSDRLYKLPQTADRWKKRSVTYRGIAEAMAQQWL